MDRESIQSIANSRLCISCGLCVRGGAAAMKYRKGMFVPFFNGHVSLADSHALYAICPGKGYPMVDIGKELYGGEDATYDYRIGSYRGIGAASSCDRQLLDRSSSGAMIPAVAHYLLENKRVDGVVTVKFGYGNGLHPVPFIATTKSDLIESQGSKYMPVPLLEIIDTIENFPGRLAVIGTPCQIAGLRLYQQKSGKLKEKIKYTIANFCGGFRDFRETERIVGICGLDKSKIAYLTYRGNGQPGMMTIRQKDGKQAQLKYPDYARLTGYIKHYRCRTCIDATGELADISFGDAWLPRFLDSGRKWSFYVCRSREMQEILRDMQTRKKTLFETISNEELYASQRGNLTTKKERQTSRYALYRLLGKRLPDFGNGGYNPHKTGLALELKVHTVHNAMYLLERLRLYGIVSKLLKRT